MGASMSMSADLLLCRRDAAVSVSSILQGAGRDTLRASPLTSSSSLGIVALLSQRQIPPLGSVVC